MSLTREQIDAFKEDLRLQEPACTGFTDGVMTAIVFIITNAAAISVQDLYGFSEQDLWKLACKAHEKRPYLAYNLPPIIRLSRGEEFAIVEGLEKQTPNLPTGKDLIEIVRVISGDIMARCLYMIAYPLTPRMAA